MICYHHNDLDGRAAAFCVKTYKPSMIPDSPESYIECSYTDKFDKHTIKDDVFIVDLSISPSTYQAFIDVCNTARTVTWIDHHRSSIDVIKEHKDELQSIKNLTYFVQECACGAALTYAYLKMSYKDLLNIRRTEEDEEYDIRAKFDNTKSVSMNISAVRFNKKNPTETVLYNEEIRIPTWLLYIDDFDCWKKNIPNSELFSLGCDSINTSLIIEDKRTNRKVFNEYFWSGLLNNTHIDSYIKSGGHIYRYINSRSDKELAFTFEWKYENTTLICKNATGYSWNFGNLLERYPAAILFFYNGKSGKWQYSVYSDKKSTFDCKAFCEKFGGGGHQHAAGFSTDKLIFLHPEIKETKPIIFLGGTCNDDPWREEFIKEWKDTTKNLPEAKNIELFNPVVDNWTEECKIKEDEVKNNASINLFVITPNIKGYYSIAEAVESANNNNGKTIFAIYDKHEAFDNAVIKSFNAIGTIIDAHNGVYVGVVNNIHNLVASVVSSI